MNKQINALMLLTSLVFSTTPTIANNLNDLDLNNDFSELKPLEAVQGYQPPVRVSAGVLKYPKARAVKSQEGIVEFLFMVETNGTTSELVVIDSTHSDFEKSTRSLILESKYEPAIWNGEPKRSLESLRAIFRMNNSQPKASDEFYRPYKRVRREFEKANPEQNKIRKDLDRMHKASFLNMYTLSFLYLEEYQYATTFLGKNEQLYALQQLLMFDDRLDKKEQFLEFEILKSIRMNILQLLIQLGRYGEARNNYYVLQKEIPEAAEPFAEPMAQVQERLDSGEVLVRQLKLKDRGSEYIYLTRNNLEIHNVKGQLEKMNFYCSMGFSSLEFKPESSYQIPDSWGSCNLLLVGEPGTTATLYQNR